ncbi:MAG: hypothetical protein KF814_06095 [Nitrospiraceae bacterium]|nr:hypothetical protein [Nitrospiraceae bacterium]
MEDSENLRTVYKELCASYRAIDDFRGKLLGFLPLVSGTGIFLLIRNPTPQDVPKEAFLPIGLFGLFVTLGLFIFEIYGIRRCTHLIVFGAFLEKQMHVEGQFTHRPLGLRTVGKAPTGLSRFVSEPLASGLVYSAVIGAWMFLILLGLGVASNNMHSPEVLRGIVVLGGFGVALGVSQGVNVWLHNTDVTMKRKELDLWGPDIGKAEDIVQNHPDKNRCGDS